MFEAETNTTELKKDKPLVLLLGSIDHEGIISTLRTSGRQYKSKYLGSSVKNWQTILDYLNEYTIEGVLVKLTPKPISLMVSNEYKEVCINVFQKIRILPHIVFIYESILGNCSSSDESNICDYSSQEAIDAVLKMLRGYNVNIMPYRKNAEITVMAESFLAKTEQHLVFRIYIPSGRIWANESNRLLQLFREYLARITNIKVRLDQYETNNGTIYEIHSEEVATNKNMGDEFSEFTQFMDLCASDMEAAKRMLKNKNIGQQEMINILSRYSKEAKRLCIDLKHEREQKFLGIRQRLESELIDSSLGETDWQNIESLVNLIVPKPIGLGRSISIDQESIGRLSIGNMTEVTINLKPQIIKTVNGIVAQEINGNQHIGLEAQQLLELINRYGEKDANELASSVHELEDISAPKLGRFTAMQKLKKFLLVIGSKIEDVATGVLQAYLEKQLGL